MTVPVRPVTVVIPTWNALAYTQACIASLRRLTDHPDWRIVAVDNGSSDGTVEWLGTVEGVQVVANQRNLGFSKACNQGIAAAGPDDDVVLLNSDVEILDPTWLHTLQRAAYEPPGAGVVGSRLVDGAGLISHLGSYMPPIALFGQQLGGLELDIGQATRNRPVESVVFAQVYLTRACIDAIGGLDEDFFSYYEDADYCVRAQRAGLGVLFAGEVTARHHGNVSTRENNVDFWTMFNRSNRTFERKWARGSSTTATTTSWSGIRSSTERPGTRSQSRKLMLALNFAGVRVMYRNAYGEDDGRVEHPLLDDIRARPVRADVPQVAFAQADAFAGVEGGPRVGWTMLEVDGLPAEWVQGCNAMDEIWVPATFNVESFEASGVRTPIHVMPLGVDVDYLHPGIAGFRPSDRFTFLSVFEWGERKGAETLLRAFTQEFKQSEDVVLVVSVYNKDPDIDVHGEIAKLDLDAGAPIVVLVNAEFADYQMGALYRSADCFVLPTRGEGWGMPVLEAMACGLPTIATAWSGPADFLTPETGYPLACAGHGAGEGQVPVLRRLPVGGPRPRAPAVPDARGRRPARGGPAPGSRRGYVRGPEPHVGARSRRASRTASASWGDDAIPPRAAREQELPMRIAVDYRILVVGPSSIHRGMGRFTQQQLREVLRLDTTNEYVLVCYADSDTSLVLPEIAAAPNVEVRRLPAEMRITGSDTEPATALRRAAEFQDWVHGLDVDLFHATTPFLLEGPIISDFDVVPDGGHVLRRHPDGLPGAVPESWPGRGYYMRTLGLLHRATRLQSISECSRRDAGLYLGFPAARNDLVYPIADPCFSVLPPEVVEDNLVGLRANHDLGGQFVLAVSDIHHAKNLESLLTAYALVPATLRDELPLVISCHLNPDSVTLRPLDGRSPRHRRRPRPHRRGGRRGAGGAVQRGHHGRAPLEVRGLRPPGPGGDDLRGAGGDHHVVVDAGGGRRRRRAGRPRGRVGLRRRHPGAARRPDPAVQDAGAGPGAGRPLHRRGPGPGDARQLRRGPTGRATRRRRVPPGPGSRSGPRCRRSAVASPTTARSCWTRSAPTHDIEVFVDDGYLPEAGLLHDHRIQHFTAFDRRNRQAPFDAVVYQMGGSTFHLYMYGPLQQVPGIVVLHDLMWSHVLYAVLRRAGRPGRVPPGGPGAGGPGSPRRPAGHRGPCHPRPGRRPCRPLDLPLRAPDDRPGRRPQPGSSSSISTRPAPSSKAATAPPRCTWSRWASATPSGRTPPSTRPKPGSAWASTPTPSWWASSASSTR